MTLSPHKPDRTPDRTPDHKTGSGNDSSKSSGNHNSSAHFVAQVALLASLALIFSYVEALIPYNPGIPGIKLGIANVVTVIALYKFSAKEAAAVSLIRIVVAGLLFTGLFGMLYSLAGAALSLAGMIILKKTDLFSVIGVSMAAGVLHNMGQLLVAATLIEDLRIFFYYPVLMFSGITAGILVGIISVFILRTVRSV
jgi:heptaprenyl diphosphate synthase